MSRVRQARGVTGRGMTRRCSGPSRRVSFFSIESRRGAGSAADRPYVIPPMNLLAEVSDKIVSTGQVWAVMVIVSAVVGVIALAWRSWGVLLFAVPISALGCLFILSFLNDPLFGDAVLR